MSDFRLPLSPDWLERFRLFYSLYRKPRIRARMCFEVDRPWGSSSGVWRYYDYWSTEWKNRLTEFYLAYVKKQPLLLASPLPLLDANSTGNLGRMGYRSAELARDTYIAQVAYALYLDIHRKIPWRLEDWSDHEMSFLLSSRVCCAAWRGAPDGDLMYVVYIGSGADVTENILHDPRVAFQFMEEEPEQGERLIGPTPSETGQRLSGWFHDYLWHNPSLEVFDYQGFHRSHPLLGDRLIRHLVEPHGEVYLTTLGCWSASALFADLMRSVNIPVRKVRNKIQSFSGNDENHCGLIFDWQGGAGTGRYLLHTDDLYTTSYFTDPAPAPKGTGRGVALWNNVWLDPGRFGALFSYDSAEDVFGRATSDQKVKNWELGQWLMSCVRALRSARGREREAVIESLMTQRGFSQAEAEACWEAVEATTLSYGNGDMELGYQRLLDGPDSRHQKWCTRTGKC